jgi:hypothetical protein
MCRCLYPDGHILLKDEMNYNRKTRTNINRTARTLIYYLYTTLASFANASFLGSVIVVPNLYTRYFETHQAQSIRP